MTWIDYALVAVIAVSVLLGVLRGFAREALSLLVWVAAFALSLHYTPVLSDLLPDSISKPWLRVALGFVLLFLATLLVGGLLVYVLARAVHKSGLGGPDRLLGLGFGLVRGLLVVSIFIAAGQMTPVTKAQWWQSSAVIGHMEGVVTRMKTAVWPAGGREQS